MMKNSHGKIGALLVLLGGLLAAPLMAAPLGEGDAVFLARINQALQAIPPMSGRFEQKLPNGGHAEGSYAIDWPDRLRFAYKGGGGIVTVKGKFVAVQEQPGGEPNWFPVALTPLSVLRHAVADGIQADMVTDLTLREDNYSITLEDPDDELPGTAQLFFTRGGGGGVDGDRLYAWRLTDVQNLVTLVRLSEIITHEKLAASHFEIIEIEEDDY
jgi:hypothetical protein